MDYEDVNTFYTLWVKFPAHVFVDEWQTKVLIVALKLQLIRVKFPGHVFVKNDK